MSRRPLSWWISTGSATPMVMSSSPMLSSLMESCSPPPETLLPPALRMLMSSLRDRRSPSPSWTPRGMLSQTSSPRVRSSSRTPTNPSSLRPMSRESRMDGKTLRTRPRRDFSSSLRPRKPSLDTPRTARLLPETLRRPRRRSRRSRRSLTLRLPTLTSPRDRRSSRTPMTPSMASLPTSIRITTHGHHHP